MCIRDSFKDIAALMLQELKDSLAEKHITLTWDESLLSYLVKKSYSAAYGARNLRRCIQKELEDVIAQRIIDSWQNPVDVYKRQIQKEAPGSLRASPRFSSFSFFQNYSCPFLKKALSPYCGVWLLWPPHGWPCVWSP